MLLKQHKKMVSNIEVLTIESYKYKKLYMWLTVSNSPEVSNKMSVKKNVICNNDMFTSE